MENQEITISNVLVVTSVEAQKNDTTGTTWNKVTFSKVKKIVNGLTIFGNVMSSRNYFGACPSVGDMLEGTITTFETTPYLFKDTQGVKREATKVTVLTLDEEVPSIEANKRIADNETASGDAASVIINGKATINSFKTAVVAA